MEYFEIFDGVFNKAAISVEIPWIDKLSERFAVADISNESSFSFSISNSIISSTSNPPSVNFSIRLFKLIKVFN